MRRIAKYLKPYVGMILLAMALLFGQANAELALPDYMSRIVNVGIQQGGVESAVPEAMRSSTLETALLFTGPNDAEQIRTAYRIVEPGDREAAELEDTYPAIADEPVAIINDLSPEALATLEPSLARGLLVAIGFEALANGAVPGAPAGGSDAAASGPSAPAAGDLAALEALGIDPTLFTAGGNPIEAIAALPEAARLQIAEQATERVSLMGENGLVQAAAASVQAEYTALGMDMARVQRLYIMRTGAVMLLLSLAGAVATILVGLLSARVAAGYTRDLRLRVFDRVTEFSSAEFDQFSTASLITRSTNDIMQLQMLIVMLIRIVFFAPIMGVGGILRALRTNASMWWIIAGAVGLLMSLIVIVYFVAVPKFKLMQKLVDRLNLVSRETLSGMLVIRAFGMQDHEEQRFDGANSDLTANTLFVNRVMVVLMPIMMLIMNGLSLVIIWVGADQIASSAMQVGDMMAFIQYTMQIVFAFLMLSAMFIMLPRAAVSADRIADVLETDPSIKDPDAPTEIAATAEPTVEFRDVSFRYPGGEEDALCGITFTSRPGTMTGIIGATGSGKSTIANLIPRFYDVTGGEVRVGGSDVRSVTQHDLREQIGYVPQKSTLFSGTIRSNLTFGREDATDEAIGQAVAVSQAAEFVEEREGGLEAEIAQGGSNVSGGQRQRLSIARALTKEPSVYLFDDSFSALDYRTDAQLRAALREKTDNSTVIVVSQRVATIRNADQILVLDDGKLVGQGTHHELMETNETYREIALSQLTEEELA